MKKPFTGRHMAIILISLFGVVISVNFYMASLAISGFGGVVVPNSYVASQEFNGWLDEAAKQEELGWSAAVERTKGEAIEVRTDGVPEGAEVSAMIRRPLGQPEITEITFVKAGSGADFRQFISTDPVPEGRWIVRLKIAAQGQNWSSEQQIR